MRFEDPGWGDYVPPPEEHRKEPGGAKPPPGGPTGTSGPPSKPPRRPWWRRGSGIAAGVGVAAVAAVLAVAAAGGGGGGGGDGTGPEPTTTGVIDGPESPPPEDPIERYLASANSICAAHRPEILNAVNTTTASGDPTGLIRALQSLQAELQGLGTPVGEGTDTYMDDLNRWVAAYQAGDQVGVQTWQSAMTRDSRESGLHKCPPN